MYKTTIGIALSALLSLSTLHASADNMAESLMKLRLDVEMLDSKIRENKESYKASIHSLMRQKDDLESVVAREDLKIKQLQQELAKVAKKIKASSKNSQGLKPLLIDALDLLALNVKDGLPFKTQDRLHDIQKIKDQITNDLVSPQKGLALTWNTYADAIRMTKENGIFKQTILLDGKERLVEVARIGTMMMFFKTPDNKVGYLSQDSTGYTYKTVLDADGQKQILALFDAFKKQIRSGYFTLPNALVSMETK